MFIFETSLDDSKIPKLKDFQIKKILIYMILISIAIIGIGVYHIVISDIAVGIFWIIIGLLYIPLVFLFTKQTKSTDHIQYHTSYGKLDETYTFDNNGITIKQTDNKEFNSVTSFKFEEIYKLYKTKQDYFLYVNKERIHIIPKSSLKSGTIDDFEKLLKNKLKSKFKKILF